MPNRIRFESGQLSHDQQKDYRDYQPKKPRKRLRFFLLILLIFIGGCSVYRFYPKSPSLEPESYETIETFSKEPKGLLKKISHFVFSKDIELSGQRKDRINVLLLGMGGAGHDGPYLTDTMIIASIKPSTNQVSMISIPRDLSVYIENRGLNKINHINAYGEIDRPGWGAAKTAEEVEKIFDLPIHYYLRLDFKAFEKIIDQVGGVTVNVDRTFTDSEYPAENHEYQTITFEKGVTTMDGETALQYARSRHGDNGEGSDFARARRQQKMLVALKQKVISFSTIANPVKIGNILKTVDNHISTNMDFTDLMNFISLANDLDTNNIITRVFDTGPNGYLKSSYTPGGAFILEPVSGNYNELASVVHSIFSKEPDKLSPPPPQQAPELPKAFVEIQNATWRAGMAARTRSYLQNKQIYVKTIGNTQERPLLESGIYKITEDAPFEVMKTLQEKLHISIKQTPPLEITPVATSTEILVILGEDFNE